MNTGPLLLLSILFLAMGVHEYDGLFSVFALTWLTLSFIALLLAALAYKSSRRIEAPSETMLVCGVVFFLYIAMFKLPGSGVDAMSTYAHFFFLSHAFLIAAFCGVFLFMHHPPRWLKRSVLGLAVIVAVSLRIGMLAASPEPKIDVFTAETRAAQLFINGESPYMPVSGEVEYQYPPLNLYLQTIAYGLAGDVRWVNIIAEVIFGFFLWRIGKRSLGAISSALAACLFFFHPRGLYVLELGWTEPPILAFLALSFWLFSARKQSAAAVAYGCMISLKQYLVFFLLHWFLLHQTRRRFAVMLGVAVLTVVPFLYLDPTHVFESGFLKTVQGGMRKDSLTFLTLLSKSTGLVLPRVTSVLVGLAVSVATFIGFRKFPPHTGFLFSASLTTFALFLFGAQAFANYYYVVSGLVLLLLVQHLEAEGERR